MAHKTLSQYLNDHGETQRAFSRRIYVREATVSDWALGKVVPSPVYLARIARATDGEVPADVWLAGLEKAAS